jgi:hypothetical protein
MPTEEQAFTGTSAGKVCCPACGGNDYAPAVELRGSFSWLVFLAGGVFAVLFRNAGRRRKVKCNDCGALFEVRAALSPLSLFLFWLLIGPTIIALIIFLLSFLRAVFLS